MTDSERMVWAAAFVMAVNDGLAEPSRGQAGWHHAAKAAHALRFAHDMVQSLRYAGVNAELYDKEHAGMRAEMEDLGRLQGDEFRESLPRRQELAQEFPVRNADVDGLATYREFLNQED